MADKLIIDCFTGQLTEQNYTQEEKQAIEQQQLENMPTLDEEIQTKLDEIGTACNTEILAGFYSSVKGTKELYGMSTDDQLNIEGLKNNVALELIKDGTLEYYKKGGVCEPWSNANFMTLYSEGMAFKTERIHICKAMKAQAQNTTTVEDLELIKWIAKDWNTVIPS